MREQTKTTIADWSISVCFGFAVWLFFAIFYRHHLHYQEQIQLFQSTAAYLAERLAVPGGLAGYLGSFFTQFYYDSFAGALVIAVFLVIMQRLVQRIALDMGGSTAYRLLSCLPSLFYALLLCNEDILLSGPIALTLSLAAVVFCSRISTGWVRIGYLLLMTPMLYWLLGIASLVFPILSLCREWQEWKREKKKTFYLVGLTVAVTVLFAGMPFMAKYHVQYPLSRLWMAGDYYRFVQQTPFLPLCVIASVIGTPLLMVGLPDIISRTNRRIGALLQLILLILVVGWGGNMWIDWNKEEVMAYDYYARTGRWGHVIALADKKSPSGPLTVSTLNLALAKEELMPDLLFSYFQNGIEGLFPSYSKEFITSVMTGEIYYHLGLINAAERYAFEAMEAVPDYQKSVRCIRRLAETSLINGQYAVAAKYLTILQNTFFYRRWATETLTVLGNEERINADPEWGKLRAYRPQEDYLFSEQEKDMMMGLLFEHNPQNKMAYEYLLAYTLLTKDLERFYLYYRMGEQNMLYRVIPRSYQEALAYIISLSNQPMGYERLISNMVQQRLNNYRQLYTSMPQPESLLRKEYADTYWYYLHFGGK